MSPRIEYGCAECGRTFDMLDATDSAEWVAGHDCEQRRAAGLTELLEFHWPGHDRLRVSAGVTSSWHYIIDTPACTVTAQPLTMQGKPCALADAYWVVASVPGTIVDGWLPGWDSNGERQRRIGTSLSYHVQVRRTELMRLLEQGTDRWTLTQVASV